MTARQLILYDGTCGLCSKAVQWLLAHEQDHELTFAPLQGETAERLRGEFSKIPSTISTVVFVDDDRVYLRGQAFLRASRHLRAPFRWGFAFAWMPEIMTTLAYRFVAAIRYKVWGRVDACQLPSPANRVRFLP